MEDSIDTTSTEELLEKECILQGYQIGSPCLLNLANLSQFDLERHFSLCLAMTSFFLDMLWCHLRFFIFFSTYFEEPFLKAYTGLQEIIFFWCIVFHIVI